MTVCQLADGHVDCKNFAKNEKDYCKTLKIRIKIYAF